MSISQVKLDLKKILENLKTLENSALDSADIKKNTAILLQNLEKKPLEKLRRKISKQKDKKQKLLLHKTKTVLKNESNKEICNSPSSYESLPITSKHKHNYTQHLKYQSFLKKVELLEELHLARGQNARDTREFSNKLNHMKQIWNTLLQEHNDEQNSELDIQEQWDRVLFGSPQKAYFKKKPNLEQFLTLRSTWDSYLDAKQGSSIPQFWVTPMKSPNDKWSKFLS